MFRIAPLRLRDALLLAQPVAVLRGHEPRHAYDRPVRVRTVLFCDGARHVRPLLQESLEFLHRHRFTGDREAPPDPPPVGDFIVGTERLGPRRAHAEFHGARDQHHRLHLTVDVPPAVAVRVAAPQLLVDRSQRRGLAPVQGCAAPAPPYAFRSSQSTASRGCRGRIMSRYHPSSRAVSRPRRSDGSCSGPYSPRARISTRRAETSDSSSSRVAICRAATPSETPAHARWLRRDGSGE